MTYVVVLMTAEPDAEIREVVGPFETQEAANEFARSCGPCDDDEDIYPTVRPLNAPDPK